MAEEDKGGLAKIESWTIGWGNFKKNFGSYVQGLIEA